MPRGVYDRSKMKAKWGKSVVSRPEVQAEQARKNKETWEVLNHPEPAPHLKVMDMKYNTEFEKDDPVEHPKHYTSHPSGVEAITITEHMNFCLGNVLKYVLRADLKENPLVDLQKARWYLDREIARRTKMSSAGV